MKEAMGSIGTAVAIAPAISAAVTPSFSPSVGSSFGELSGGSFRPATSFESIFKDTRPFIGSLGSVPEGPISNPSGIFTDTGWATIARSPVQDSIFGSSAAVILHTKPMTSFDFGTREGPVKFDQKDFIAVATNPLIKTEVGIISTDKGTEEASVSERSDKKKEQKQREGEERLRILRLAILFEQVGLYNKKEALEKATEVKAKASVKVAEKPQAKAEAQVIRSEQEVLQELQDVEAVGVGEEEEKKVKKRIAKNQPEESYTFPKLVVDEKAQTNRKKTTKEVIAAAFKISRILRLPYVSGKEIALSLEEKREHKSRLLEQIDKPKFPDGSFYQAAAQIYELPQVRDLTDRGQWVMQKRTEEVLDENRPVELAESNLVKKATPYEAKRVLRFVEYFLGWY